MPQYLYTALAGENKISIFSMDPDTGHLEFKQDVQLGGSPGPLAVAPEQNFMYAGIRSTREISSFRIDQRTGSLSMIGTVSLESDPCFMTTDRSGRFLLSAYYGAGRVSVHPISANGAASAPPVEWRATADKAHCIQLDSSNRFAFVPHVMTANVIFQFRFDESTGKLVPGDVPRAIPPEGVGPRHFCFHPDQDFAYFDNEQGSSVTAYRFDPSAGTLTPFQTVSTLPVDFDGSNSCAQIHIAPSGDFLYASNRGHDSIAIFAIDGTTGELAAIGQQPTLETPRAFNLDPAGRFLFVGGLVSGELASYRIDTRTGTLEPLETYTVGEQPMWVLVLRLGE